MGNKVPQLSHGHSHKRSPHHDNSGNSEGHGFGSGEADDAEGDHHHMSKRKSRKYQTVALIKLFEKLELTEDGGNSHPGELSRVTFENAFHGPLHKFGKLMYLNMMTVSTATNRERITREQFVKAGKEILKMHDERTIVKYYFHFFAEGKDFLTPEDAKRMFEVSFALTLSVSKILYQEDERDPRIFAAMVTGLFGIKTELNHDDFSKWLNEACPHMFHSVHNWISNVLTGSALPEEMEVARFPQLEGVVSSNNCTSMAILWLLSNALPAIYTKPPEPPKPPGASGASNSPSASTHALGDTSAGGLLGATKDPMWTSMLLLRKLARLPQVQFWKLLYNSDDHGLSINRFNNHVSAYHAPNVTFMAFEGRNLYCLAIDKGWTEGPEKFGGPDCMLIQILPVYRVVQAGEKMIRWSETARDVPKGISVGCTGMSEVLRLSTDFDKIMHYNAPCELHKLEVWGCGSEIALEAQKTQRKWELGAVQREQSRKLRPMAAGEGWEDSPDKQILQWGGVNVGNHSYNR